MKWLAWAFFVLGLWILVGGFMPAINVVSIIAGIVIAVLSIIGAIKG